MRRIPTLLAVLAAIALALPAAAQTVVVGDPGAPGQDGESVEGSEVVVVEGADPVLISLRAEGGLGGPAVNDSVPAGDGGGVGFGEVFGRSGSGEVSVSVLGQGGQGGNGLPDAEVAGDGASVRLVNEVDGETSGNLLLGQAAIGGAWGGHPGGRGGAAESILARRKSAESFRVSSTAIAGSTTFPSVSDPSGGAGRPASSVAKAANTSGEASSFAIAVGGRGGSGDGSAPGHPGGKATAFAQGRSFGDGERVQVGHPPIPTPLPGRALHCDVPQPPLPDLSLAGDIIIPPIPPIIPGPVIRVLSSGAIGGPGGGFSLFEPEPTPPGGDGGDADSTSIGLADGDSEVLVADRAEGGSGGGQTDTEPRPSTGGSAHSLGLGKSGGEEPVRVCATAVGGAAGAVGSFPPNLPPGTPPPEVDLGQGVVGGPAKATAVAMGEGEVLADALAEGGIGTRQLFAPQVPQHPGGLGQAAAAGVGASGEVIARGASTSPSLRIETRASAEVVKAARAEATIGSADKGIAAAPGADAFASSNVPPGEKDLARLLMERPDLAQSLADAGVEDIVAKGLLGATQKQSGDALVSRLEIDLRTLSFAPDPVDSGYVALFDPRIRAAGFVSLEVVVAPELGTPTSLLFDDPAAAEAWLDGLVAPFGPMGSVSLLPPPRQLFRPAVNVLSLVLTTSEPGAGMQVGFLVGTSPLP